MDENFSICSLFLCLALKIYFLINYMGDFAVLLVS